jgi:hypothetical protein
MRAPQNFLMLDPIASDFHRTDGNNRPACMRAFFGTRR